MENLAIENTDNNNNDKKSNIVVNQKSNFRSEEHTSELQSRE